MKVIENVIGTMEDVIPVEVGSSTVYVRENIQRMEATENLPEHWTYQETQLTVNEYHDIVRQESLRAVIAQSVALNTYEK